MFAAPFDANPDTYAYCMRSMQTISLFLILYFFFLNTVRALRDTDVQIVRSNQTAEITKLKLENLNAFELERNKNNSQLR